MAKKRAFGFAGVFIKSSKKNKGIHSKNNHTSNKNGKYYTGTRNGWMGYR